MSVGLDAEKLRVEERIEHFLADLALDPAQTLDLFGFQLQSRHFQVLTADAIDDIFNRAHDNLLLAGDNEYACRYAGAGCDAAAAHEVVRTIEA
jgi:hypothetical protein